MSGPMVTIIVNTQDEQNERCHEEREWTLLAIAGAIADGRLTPDDAFAWARIAACEAEGSGSYVMETSR